MAIFRMEDFDVREIVISQIRKMWDSNGLSGSHVDIAWYGLTEERDSFRRTKFVEIMSIDFDVLANAIREADVQDDIYVLQIPIRTKSIDSPNGEIRMRLFFQDDYTKEVERQFLIEHDLLFVPYVQLSLETPNEYICAHSFLLPERE